MMDQLINSIDQAMTAAVAKRWWVFALRGLLAVIFAVLAFTLPADTLGALVLVFGIFALFDGIISIVGSVTAAELREPWWPLVLRGVIGIAAGLFTFSRPDMTALVLVYLIAFWAILGGAMELVGAFEFHDVVPHAWLLGLAGVASIIFGILAAYAPGAGATAIVWILGVYAAVYGVTYLVFGFQLLGVSRRTPRTSQSPAPATQPSTQPSPSAATA